MATFWRKKADSSIYGFLNKCLVFCLGMLKDLLKNYDGNFHVLKDLAKISLEKNSSFSCNVWEEANNLNGKQGIGFQVNEISKDYFKYC